MGVGLKAATLAVSFTMLLSVGVSTSAAADCSSVQGGLAKTVCGINNAREAHGLAPLHVNMRLNRAAERLAMSMRQYRYFGHVTPQGKDLKARVASSGYLRHPRYALGEDIAWGEDVLGTPAAIVNGWMHSPEHRRNILYSKFTDVGIGIVNGSPMGGNAGAIYVADFGMDK
jgi:uncharacterized protein YkwD